MAFEAITTQEQFDEAIKPRLARENKKYEGFISPEELSAKYVSVDELKKYENWESPEEVAKKYEGFLSPEEAKKKDDEIKRHERDSAKMKLAHEFKIPFEMASRIEGDDEAAMRADAEALSKYMSSRRAAPSLNHEEHLADSREKNLKAMLDAMKGE